MMRAFTACLLITLAPFGAGAMTNYEACIALVKSNPERAQNEALAWYQASGDLGALHCEALALAAQGASRTAAEKLEALAAAPEIDADTSAEIRMQAALLYRQGGDDKSAETVLTPALSESRGGDCRARFYRARLDPRGRRGLAGCPRRSGRRLAPAAG